MADKKISALPASTTPLAGTEVLPIVQSGATTQVSVANLTAGRAISATQLTLTTGNVIVANGQGIDFSATPNTGTSELFADYEEGDWTPDLRFGGSATGITYTSRVGKYIKIGKSVYVTFDINLSSKGSATGGAQIYALPFTSRTEIGVSIAVGIQINMAATVTFQNRVENDGTIISLGQPSGVTTQAVTDTSFNNNTRIAGSGFYFVP